MKIENFSNTKQQPNRQTEHENDLIVSRKSNVFFIACSNGTTSRKAQRSDWFWKQKTCLPYRVCVHVWVILIATIQHVNLYYQLVLDGFDTISIIQMKIWLWWRSKVFNPRIDVIRFSIEWKYLIFLRENIIWTGFRGEKTILKQSNYVTPEKWFNLWKNHKSNFELKGISPVSHSTTWNTSWNYHQLNRSIRIGINRLRMVL